MLETQPLPCQSKDKYNHITVISAFNALKKKGRNVKHYKCSDCDGYHITSIMDYTEPKVSEEVLMSNCVKWANNTYPELRFWGIVHIPNGGKRTKFERNKSKALGIRSGFPDLQIILPSGKIFFIEMKTSTGTQSKDQKACQEWMAKRRLEYFTINNEKDFKELINLNMKK